MIDKTQKIEYLENICSNEIDYNSKIEAYEFLMEEGEEIIDEMLAKLYTFEGDTALMILEILANFKGRKEIYMWLVTFLYRGEDLAIIAKLIGGYQNDAGIEVLNDFARDNELDYNEFMEFRNAVEELGGVFQSKQDFEDDPFYKYIKGLDDEEAVKEDMMAEENELANEEEY